MSNTSVSQIDVQKSIQKLLRRVAVDFAMEDLSALRESLGPDDWDTFHQRLQSLLTRIESASTEDELTRVVNRLLFLLGKYLDVWDAFQTYLVAASPALGPVVVMLRPSQLLIRDVGKDSARPPTLPALPAAAEEELSPRYSATALCAAAAAEEAGFSGYMYGGPSAPSSSFSQAAPDKPPVMPTTSSIT